MCWSGEVAIATALSARDRSVGVHVLPLGSSGAQTVAEEAAVKASSRGTVTATLNSSTGAACLLYVWV